MKKCRICQINRKKKLKTRTANEVWTYLHTPLLNILVDRLVSTEIELLIFFVIRWLNFFFLHFSLQKPHLKFLVTSIFVKTNNMNLVGLIMHSRLFLSFKRDD